MFLPPKSQFAINYCFAVARFNGLNREEIIELFTEQFTVEELSECLVDLMIFNEEQNQPQNQHEQASADFDKAMEVVWKELDSRRKN